jgi:UDP-N-acetylmuramoyl-L-alanyl-D-glutamate--2,6-diaminopimelate ligase
MTAPCAVANLLYGIVQSDVKTDLSINGLSLASAQIEPGNAFVALQGANQHGLRFAEQAAKRGAVMVLADDVRNDVETNTTLPVFTIKNLRMKLGEIANRFYSHPSHDLPVIGVTGTNGKTSCVQLLAAALAHLDSRAATLGTLGGGLYGALIKGERTTPDVLSTHKFIAKMRDDGAQVVAMEVSSHALDQGRVDGVQFRTAVFTNLTQDHLDYHQTMAQYGAAKAKLFAWPLLRAAVINIDDAFGAKLAKQAQAKQLVRFSAVDKMADVYASEISLDSEGLSFVLNAGAEAWPVRSNLLGHFNVSNLLGVAATLHTLGFSFTNIAAVLGHLQPIHGRMNKLGGGDLPLVVVDYAHTPDALEQSLSSLRAHTRGKLICVFGCGGERDRGKRPLMGAIAQRLADQVVLTDDNPRGESGDVIIADIVAGIADMRAVAVQRDRQLAIAQTIRQASVGDVILLAGKGHEDSQEVAGVLSHFDDTEQARAALASLRP